MEEKKTLGEKKKLHTIRNYISQKGKADCKVSK